MGDFGNMEGDTCFRNGCQGVIQEASPENCSCHLHAPCSSCMEDRTFCPACDWRGKDDHGTINDYSVAYKDRKSGVLASWTPRPLDVRKIDWRTKAHTNSSQVCEGVYPAGTTREDVEKCVRGTFGGRFNYFGNGKFEYVAYTD